MEDEFILIGWVNNFSNPIIVPKNVQWRLPNCPLSLSLSLTQIDGIRGVQLYIILSQLYKLENIRNLDLHDDLLRGVARDFARGVANTTFVDTNCNTILTGIGYTREGIQTKDEYYRYQKDKIREIEANYPGLLKPIYLEDGINDQAPIITNQEVQLRGGKRSTTKRHIKTRKSNTKKNK
jgi:hypothetical protein